MSSTHTVEKQRELLPFNELIVMLCCNFPCVYKFLSVSFFSLMMATHVSFFGFLHVTWIVVTIHFTWLYKTYQLSIAVQFSKYECL